MSGSKSIVPFGNFFDRVRVRVTPVTEGAGLAGRTGQVYGETRPSSSGVARTEIIGELTEDYAVNVQFDELGKSVWFTRELLEFVDHAPGTKITRGRRTWVREESGLWIETSAKAGPGPEEIANPQRDNLRVKVIAGIVIAILLLMFFISRLKRL
jgi:hypothetical protein